MKMCRKCLKWMKNNRGYLNGQEKIVRQNECNIHPKMDNIRVIRTAKTLLALGLEPRGHKILVANQQSMSPQRVTISLGSGWIHEKNVYMQLFDYERPFVELLIREGIIERGCQKDELLDSDVAAIRITRQGYEWVNEKQLELEDAKVGTGDFHAN